MPYIPVADRVELLHGITNPMEPGELNFKITSEILYYMRRKGVRYTTLNEIVGVLESVKAEFQRRVIAPYEDKKIQENGDVYK